MKTRATRLLTLAAGAMPLMALVLVPAAPAATNIYTENFIGNTPAGIYLSNAGVGWDGGNFMDGDSRVAAGWGSATTPDGDYYYTARPPGESTRSQVITKVGEYTITSANRIGTQFKVDWAANVANGMRFIARVGGKWYATAKKGTGTTDHGTMSGMRVTQWVSNQTVSVETDTWYQWIAPFEEAGLSSTALTGVPAGDITQFGLWFGTANNGHQYATDNFRVDATSAGETYVWDGGAGNWTNANWTYGGSSGQTPATGYPMFIDAGGGSTVAVAADFLSALTVDVGQNNAAALAVNGGSTLGVTQKATVGPSGTLQVDGTLTSPTLISYGNVAVSDTGIVNATNSVQIAGGSLTCSSNGALNVGAGKLSLDGGTGATLDGPLNITGGTIVLNSGTLTYNNATPATPAVLVFSGGVLAGAGSVVPTNRYEAYNVTVTNNLTGGTGVSVVAASGTVRLTGTNDYGGNTEIRADISTTILRVADATNIPMTGNLFMNSQGRFQQDARYRPAILETKGTIERDIGTGAGKIRFAVQSGDGKSSASFAAVGGPLVVRLDTNATPATLDWDNTSTGLCNMWLEFGSANADDVVTFKNGLNMKSADRNIYVWDNSGSTNDYAVIEGGIINDATPRKLTKDQPGRLVLTGTNTYTGNTAVEDGTLEIGGAGQLGAGNYAGNITIANGRTFKYNSSTNQILSGIVGTANQAGIVIKDGAGTLTLSGANIYTGTTTVNGGTLNLSSPGSLGATAVTVSANTKQPVLKVSGNYTIGTPPTAGSLTVSGGAAGSQGTLSLVDGTVNTLTLANNSASDVFTIGSANASENSILNMEVGATSDRIEVSGTSTVKLLASGKKTVVNITGLGNLSGERQTLIHAPGGVGTVGGTRVSFEHAFELGAVSGNVSGYTLTLGSDETRTRLYLIATGRAAVLLVR